MNITNDNGKELFDVEQLIRKLEEKGMVIRWLIAGGGIHCIPVGMAAGLTKERIVELYNTDMEYFTSK